MSETNGEGSCASQHWLKAYATCTKFEPAHTHFLLNAYYSKIGF